MNISSRILSTPPTSLGLLELRALADAAYLPGTMLDVAFRKNQDLGKGRHVCVLPGFGANDRAMLPLRYFLSRHGFKAFGWGLGLNKAGLDLPHSASDINWQFKSTAPENGETGVPYLCELMTQRIHAYANEKGVPVTLVGWSLGGTIAREVARDLPGNVDQVITLGSPVIGGPKYTKAAPILRRRGLDLDWIESEVEHRNRLPIKQPVSAIVSKTDGVVDWSASIQEGDHSTNYIVEDVAHLGMGINRSIMNTVLRELCSLPKLKKESNADNLGYEVCS